MLFFWRQAYRFNHGFGSLIAHWHVMHPVLVTEVTHDLIGGVKHLSEVGEEPKTPESQ